MGPGRPIDPGGDRVSATPIQDACAAFPDANLLAINVSGQPIFTDATMKCPLLEVRIDPQPVAPEEIMALGDGYRRRRSWRDGGARGDARRPLARLVQRAPADDRKRVIIVGAGFGGLAAAKALARATTAARST